MKAILAFSFICAERSFHVFIYCIKDVIDFSVVEKCKVGFLTKNELSENVVSLCSLSCPKAFFSST